MVFGGASSAATGPNTAAQIATENDALLKDVIPGQPWPKSCLGPDRRDLQIVGNELSFEEFRWKCYADRMRAAGGTAAAASTVSENDFMEGIVKGEWAKIVEDGLTRYGNV